MSLNIIQQLFPSKLIFYRLSDLLKESLSSVNEVESLCLSIETSNRSRRFSNFSLFELCTLFANTIESERSLYEIIPLSKSVKLYIDFEYLICFNDDIQDHASGLRSILKILYSVFYSKDISTDSEEEVLNLALQKFLVMTA